VRGAGFRAPAPPRRRAAAPPRRRAVRAARRKLRVLPARCAVGYGFAPRDMAQNTVICPSCGFKNTLPLQNSRCVSCGAKIEELKRSLSRQEELERRYQQQGFSVAWFGISILIMGVLTAAIIMGLPMVIPMFDFEGQAGMLVAIPVWFVGGMLVGLVSPGRTFIEPVAAAILVSMPTAFLLFRGQTVKTMPFFMYILWSAVGVLFSLIGSYMGERVQMGPVSKATSD
jgi:predicted nucleic acid-binding Zn ribbon protein